MKKFTFILGAMLLGISTANINAASLWIVGDATLYGWSLDDATALLSKPDNSAFYTGTIYLKADANFKFMTVPDYGNTDYPQYGASKDATFVDGKISLTAGTDDDFTQIQLPEEGNYYITVDTESLEATFVKSDYQATEIGLCSLFLVGDATEGGWSVDDGTPLYQEKDSPYVYSADVNLTEGSFKIATVMKGGGSWDSKYYYFCDPQDPGKIILNNSEDTQWRINEAAVYTVTVNTIQETISIVKSESGAVEGIDSENEESVEFFTLSGVRVSNPENGIYICRKGSKVYKRVIR